MRAFLTAVSGVRPYGWTESSWRFDRLPGVLILELRQSWVRGHRAYLAVRAALNH
jgi:hypothetical protein